MRFLLPNKHRCLSFAGRGNQPHLNGAAFYKMNRDDYQKYLQSSHWRKVKAQYKKRYKYVCYLCGATDILHLHHVTYERIGNENLTDLVYLCENCHSFIHQDGLEAQDLRAWVNPVLRPAQGINEKYASWETKQDTEKPVKKTKYEPTVVAIGIYKSAYCVTIGNKQSVKLTDTEDWERLLLLSVLEADKLIRNNRIIGAIRIELQEHKDKFTLSCLKDTKNIKTIKSRNWRALNGYKMSNTDLWDSVLPFCSTRDVKFVISSTLEPESQAVVTARNYWSKKHK